MTTTPSEPAGHDAATREAAASLAGVETAAPLRDAAPSSRPPGITGAQSLVRSLEAMGVEVIFGIPGGAILPAYDPLFDSEGPPRPGPPRAGRRARGHRLRAGHRQGRRLHGHLRARARPTW